MLDKALCNDLRHSLGGLILCQLPAACEAQRERSYDFAGIGGGELVVGVRHPQTIAEALERIGIMLHAANWTTFDPKRSFGLPDFRKWPSVAIAGSAPARARIGRCRWMSDKIR